MAKRVGGFRHGTRQKLKKNIRKRGKLSITNFFQKFNSGDKVLFDAEPAYQKGMYFPRFHSRTGIVVAKRGACYEVKIQDFRKEKTFVVHPVHLRKI